jgi:hypothetical protein
MGSNKGAKGQSKAPSSGARGLSGVPPDSVRCTRGLQAELFTFGNFSEAPCYNSPDCPVYTGQCSMLQGDATLNSPASGILNG